MSEGDERGTSERPSDSPAPWLRIITPDATPEEVAAIVAVLSALASGGEPRRAQPVSEWNSPYRQVRPFYSHGPGGWRSSGLPKHRGRGN